MTKNIKPFEKIASQFQMSQESAKYFLGQVQKSFKKEQPPHKLNDCKITQVRKWIEAGSLNN